MPFDYAGAKQAGYSDEQIAASLAQRTGFDLARAMQAGYDYDAVIPSMLQRLDSVQPVPPVPESPPPVEDQSFLRSVADVPLGVSSGLVSGIRNVADAFGAGSAASEALLGAEDYLDSLMSAQSKQDSQEIARILQDAQDKGMGEQVLAGLKALSIAPIDVLSKSLGAFAPVVAATVGTVASGGAPLLATGATLGASAIMGAGLIKGDIYNAVKSDPTLVAEFTPEKLEAVAQEAQAYGGKNLDQILLGAGLFGLESAVGVPKQLSQLTTRILLKAGTKEAAEAAAKEAVEAAGKKILPTAIKEGAVSGGAEFLQEGQEQVAENLALQREGVDVDAFEGALPRASLGAGMGVLAGGVGAGVNTSSEQRRAQEFLDATAGSDRTAYDVAADAADELGDTELATHYRERAAQELEGEEELDVEEPLSDIPPPSDEQAAQDQAGTSSGERPIRFDLPANTPEDLEYLAGQAEASGDEEAANMYREAAAQRQFVGKEAPSTPTIATTPTTRPKVVATPPTAPTAQPEAATEPVTQPEAAALEVTKEALQSLGVKGPALRTKSMRAVLDPATPVEDKAKILELHADNPVVAPEAKAKIRSFAGTLRRQLTPRETPVPAVATTTPTAPAAVKPKKATRGRPKVLVTEEQKLEQGAKRTRQVSDINTTSRLLGKGQQLVALPFDEFMKRTEGLDPLTPAEWRSFTTEHKNKLDPELVARGEAHQRAMTNIQYVRDNALANAYRVLKTGTPAARKTASETISHPSVDEAERTQAQKEAKRAPGLVRAEGKSAAADPAYAGFTTADQILSYVFKTGTAFQRALAARLKPLMKGVKVVMVNSLEDVPAGAVRDTFSGVDASGANAGAIYSDSDSTIYVNSMEGEAATDADTALHEALHAATVRIITAWMENPASLSVHQQSLVGQLNQIMKAANARLIERRNLGLLTPGELALYEVGAFSDLREFVAYGLTNADMQAVLLETDGSYVPSQDTLGGMLTRFVRTILRLVGLDADHISAFQDLVIVTDQLLSAGNRKLPPIALSTAARLTKQDKLLNKQAASARGSEFPGVMGRMTKEFRDSGSAINTLRGAFATMGNKAVAKIVPVLTTDDLSRWVGNRLANFRRVTAKVNEMAGWRNKELRRIAETQEGWAKFTKRNPPAQKMLGTLMQVSTIVEGDPTAYGSVQAALNMDSELKALTAESKDSKLTAKQRSAAKGRATSRANDLKLVYKLWDSLAKLDPTGAAHKWYTTIKNEYERTFNELVKKIELSEEIEGDKANPQSAKGALIAEIVHNFQEAKKKGVYFPLVRYGPYWLRMGQSGHKDSAFYMFESEFARDAFAEAQARAVSKTKDQMVEDMEMDFGNDPSKLRAQVEADSSSQMLKNVYGLLDAKTSGATVATSEIKDAIYRLYLHTLPDRDMRKRFLKRQGRTGYNTDVLRNYVTTQHTAVNQLARLKYAGDIRVLLSAARDELAGNPDKLKLEPFIDELTKRVELEVQPSTDPNDVMNKIASIGNKAVFYYMMTAPRSAFVQLTQLPVVGLPVLGSKFGYPQAAATLGKYLNVFSHLSTTRTDADGNVVTEWGQPSLRHASYIKDHADPEYREAMAKAWETMHNNGVFTVTYAGDMSERGSMPTDPARHPIRSALGVVGNFMSGALHHMERLSREIMGMASFELAYASARKSGLAAEEALEQAVKEATELAQEGLFNYTQFNKPRLFKHPVGRIPTQFMTFPLQMTSYLFRNFAGMLPFLNAEGKKEAAERFFTTMAMTFMFAGATGLPLYSLLMGMLDKYRELMRPELDPNDPEAYTHYDEADPTNPWGKRSYDLYFRDTVVPRYFGNGSSVANYLGLSESQAQTLARGMELGPISAFTDMNIGSSVTLDNMWFRDTPPAEDNRAAFEKLALAFLGPLGAAGSQIAGALDDLEAGELQRGFEKLLPAFFRGALTATRLGAEGLRTPGQDAQVMDAEFYTTGKLLTRSMGFNSTTEAEVQKSRILAKQMQMQIDAERDALMSRVGKLLIASGDSPTDEQARGAAREGVMEIAEFNMRNPFTLITSEGLTQSVQNKVQQRVIAGTLQGLVVPDNMYGVIAPMVRSSAPVKD